MTLPTLTLVVVAALLHATWNLLSKRAAAAGAPFVFAYTLIACLAYAPWAIWLIARGEMHWNTSVVVCIAASGVIHLTYSLCLQRGYQVADLSVIYPVARGTGPLLSSIGAFVVLGEQPSWLWLAGMLSVIAGIGLISTNGNFAAFARPTGWIGVRWGLLSGALISCYTLVDAYGVKSLAIAPLLMDWFANLLRPVLLAPIVIRDPRRALGALHGHWWTAVGVGLISPAPYILVLAAMERGAPASVVAPSREISMMVAALLGLLILGEKVGPWRVAGCAAMIAGVVILGFSTV
jgi:drug/metabolite transporter (DMT)-like permease